MKLNKLFDELKKRQVTDTIDQLIADRLQILSKITPYNVLKWTSVEAHHEEIAP